MLALRCGRRAAVCSCPAAPKVPGQPAPRPTASCSSRWSPVAGARWERLRGHAGRGGGLLDNVVVTPGNDTTKEVAPNKRKPPIYKVLLHNDNFNRREYVVKILLKVVDAITVDDAVNVMQEAHETGVALVVACAQDQAEGYVEGLRLNGLISTMEPGH